MPLADTASLRRLAFVLPAITAAALFLGALAPSASLLALITGILAVTTVLPQIIMPTAAALAAPGRSGRVVGAVSTGLILGILLSRVVSGALAELSGSWRTPLPSPASSPRAWRCCCRPSCRRAAARRAIACPMAPCSPPCPACSATMRRSGSRRCSAPACSPPSPPSGPPSPSPGGGPYHLGLGLCRAVRPARRTRRPARTLAGRLSDCHGSHAANLVGLVCVAAAFLAFAAFGSHSLRAIVIGCNLLDCGVQSGQIANQARIFALGAAFRGRVNTIYMVCVFSGGAVGSLVGVNAYGAFGWAGVCAAGAGFIAIAAAGSRRRLARTGATPSRRL